MQATIIAILRHTTLVKPVFSLFLFLGVLMISADSTYISKVSTPLERKKSTPLDSLRKESALTLHIIEGKIKYYELKPNNNGN